MDAEAAQEAPGVPALQSAPGAAEAASEHTLLILPMPRLIERQRMELEHRIQAQLAQIGTEGQCTAHRDVTTLRCLLGAGHVVAATMLAEASQPLAERDFHAFRSYVGAAPVSRQSGKRTGVLSAESPIAFWRC